MSPPLTILVVQNHYQQRGGEDSVFETECKMLEDAGNTVIRYEKHNDEISEKGLGARGQGLGSTTAEIEPAKKTPDNQVQRNDDGACPADTAPQEPNLNAGVAESELVQPMTPPTSNDAPSSSSLCSSVPPCLCGEEETSSNPVNLVNPVKKNSLPSVRSVVKNKIRLLRINLSLFTKTIWNAQSYREITSLIQQQHPDIVHCHNTFPLISPSVYWAAAKQGIPVVQTLHNYRLICINPYLYRNGQICERCLGHSPLPGIIHRCYRGSLSASFTVAAMLMIHRLLGTYRNKVSTYIALTEFARQKFITAGLPAEKIVVKPNAVGSSSSAKGSKEKQWLGARGQGTVNSNATTTHSAQPPSPNTYPLTPNTSEQSAPPIVLYVGRLSPEKGVDILIRAWALCQNKLPTGSRLHIIGDGLERVALETLAAGMPSIKFLGRIAPDKIATHMQAAIALVLPSRCYEMFAVTPLEAMYIGLPVILSSSALAGSIITDQETGLVFETDNPQALADILYKALSKQDSVNTIAHNARIHFITSNCMPEENTISLTEIYQGRRTK